MYECRKETMNEYKIIVNQRSEYSVDLENTIIIIEREVVRALEKQYSEILIPLKDSMTPKKFVLQYMQKLTRGLFLNTIKRILDVLHPRVEIQLKSWASCLLVLVTRDRKDKWLQTLVTCFYRPIHQWITFKHLVVINTNEER
jgi:hypothetical protein